VTRRILRENSSPIGLAAAVGLSILLGILLWPWGIIVATYLAMRLHLNKIAALVGIALSIPPAVAGFSQIMGHWVVGNSSRPRLERFVGSHIIAFAMAAVAIWLVYNVARRWRCRSAGIEA
jgi:uncharacterized protein (DUF2062 family)